MLSVTSRGKLLVQSFNEVQFLLKPLLDIKLIVTFEIVLYNAYIILFVIAFEFC